MKIDVPRAVMLDLDDTIVQFSVLKTKCWNTVCSEFSSQLQKRKAAVRFQVLLKQLNDSGSSVPVLLL